MPVYAHARVSVFKMSIFIDPCSHTFTASTSVYQDIYECKNKTIICSHMDEQEMIIICGFD